RSFLGLENEALIVKCPRQGKYPYSVDWYYSKTNKSITTQRGNRIVASGKCLKFLPAKVNDSGFYTCVVRRPTSNKTGHVNVTIFEKQSDCNIPDYLIYSTTFGSEKKSLIFCPTIDRYNWTQPVEWFKNCEVLQGPRYLAHKTFLLIHNATNKDTGKPTNITCLACFGKGHQVMAEAFWRVKGSEVKNFGETRIQGRQELMQSCTVSTGSNSLLFNPSGELTCLRAVLKIEDVKEEDLTWKYDCLAMNFHGFITHTITLRRKNPNGKIYDAYVIYPRSCKNSPEGASSVEYFVHQILPDVLENKCGYNLCIYGRDLLPGQDVASTVETSIRMSRRHLFILTAEIVHSKEFTYEREIALHSALIQQDSKAILIEMEALCPSGGLQLEELQDSLKHLIKVQGTIKWREDVAANRRSLNSKFWKHTERPSIRLSRKP
ncbi:IL1RL1, partial [Cervus elaphus hippelaphus]